MQKIAAIGEINETIVRLHSMYQYLLQMTTTADLQYSGTT